MIKKLLLPLYLRAHRLMMKICWNLFIHAPLDHRKVVFSNFNGGGYGDNPKFIAQEFLRRNCGWKLYWVSASDYDLPEGLTPGPAQYHRLCLAHGHGGNLGGRYPEALLL